MQSTNRNENSETGQMSLALLCWEFLKIGTFGFGGGWVIIALIREKFVNKEKLISDEEFAVGISLGQLLGAFAVNTTSYVGRKLGGITGAFLSTFFFLLPSFVIVCLFAEFYFRSNQLFALEGILKGITPVIISLLLSTAYDLSVKIKKNIPFFIILFIVIGGGLIRVNYVVLLLFSGLFYLLIDKFTNRREKSDISSTNLLIFCLNQPQNLPGSIPILFSIANAPSIFTIGIVFFGIGFIFFGGGYSLIPILQNIFVTKLNWISNHDFIIGMAISQVTPGPFAVISTFLGYYLKGVTGAFISTFTIFMPPFIFMQLLINFQNKFKNNNGLQAFLKGINIAIIGQLLLLSYHFFIDILVPLQITSIIMLLCSFLLFFIYRIPPIILIIFGIIYGFFFVK
ncbi:MAG TPA: chromate efflux transporter [Candidatus Hydrogenedens sp.]|nr:chromate efflux transporter [Candidatus Hydrogenedens sp.]